MDKLKCPKTHCSYKDSVIFLCFLNHCKKLGSFSGDWPSRHIVPSVLIVHYGWDIFQSSVPHSKCFCLLMTWSPDNPPLKICWDTLKASLDIRDRLYQAFLRTAWGLLALFLSRHKMTCMDSPLVTFNGIHFFNQGSLVRWDCGISEDSLKGTHHLVTRFSNLVYTISRISDIQHVRLALHPHWIHFFCKMNRNYCPNFSQCDFEVKKIHMDTNEGKFIVWYKFIFCV